VIVGVARADAFQNYGQCSVTVKTSHLSVFRAILWLITHCESSISQMSSVADYRKSVVSLL
jgi:hypothetical protein